MAQNEDALELWAAVRTQWRAGSMGVIGLDYRVLYLEAERLEINLSNCMMKKIKVLEKSVLESMAESSKKRGSK